MVPVSQQSKLAILAAASPSILRPLAADIPGNHTERLYFHRFRQIAEEALGIRHVHNGLFWKQIVPQYCHEVTAVKHAYIAVGAAYSHFHQAGRKPDPNAPPTEAERFVIRQYSRAMESIPLESKGLPVKRQYGITMMCCAAFFCIEMLRGEWDQALKHLANGVRMMADLPDDVADILHNPAKWSQGMDTSYVRVSYMIQLLTRWEVSIGHMVSDFQPLLTLQAYQARQLEQSVSGNARSVEELQDIVDNFCQDVNAFSWQTRHHRGDDLYWSDAGHKLQYWALKQRSDGISALLQNHKDLHNGYTSGTTEHTSYHVSLLNHRVATLTMDSAPLNRTFGEEPSVDDMQRIEELVNIAVMIQEGQAAGDATAARFSVDVGVVPTLHVAARHCTNVATRNKIAALIREWPRKESFWDGPVMRELVM